MTERKKCCVDECDRDAEPGRSMCAAHRKRKQRHGSTGPPEIRRRNGTFRSMLNLALDLGDVDPDDDFEWERVKRRFRRALDDFAERRKPARRCRMNCEV